MNNYLDLSFFQDLRYSARYSKASVDHRLDFVAVRTSIRLERQSFHQHSPEMNTEPQSSPSPQWVGCWNLPNGPQWSLVHLASILERKKEEVLMFAGLENAFVAKNEMVLLMAVTVHVFNKNCLNKKSRKTNFPLKHFC